MSARPPKAPPRDAQDAPESIGGGPNAAVVLVAIGGFDPTGGAGLTRDLLTARAWGARVRLVPTAWTAQSEDGVTEIEPRDPEALRRAVVVATATGAIEDCCAGTGTSTSAGAGLTATAVKIGMLVDARLARVVAAAIAGFPGPVVLDPVVVASSGGAPLYAGDPASLLPLLSATTLVTPNANEATWLTGLSVDSPEQAERAGRALIARGLRAVLIKGGHIPGGSAADVLVTRTGEERFSAAWVPGPPVRGTGCALATAIAVELGRGRPLGDAIANAKGWLTGALEHAIDVDGERHLS